jgi:hypothetical protein
LLLKIGRGLRTEPKRAERAMRKVSIRETERKELAK